MPDDARDSQQKDDLERLRTIVRKVQTGMLMTIDPSVGPRARPVQVRDFDENARLWFITRLHSPKVDELLASDGEVCISFAERHAAVFASVTGRACIVPDSQRLAELWTLDDDQWYPGGASNPDVVLMRVDLAHAQWWDRPSDPLTRGIGMIQSLVFGDNDISAGEEGKVDRPAPGAATGVPT